MMVVMEMSTGKYVSELKDEYGDEVLMSNWLPQPQVGLGLQEAVSSHRDAPPADAEAFLRTVYLSQE